MIMSRDVPATFFRVIAQSRERLKETGSRKRVGGKSEGQEQGRGAARKDGKRQGKEAREKERR